MSTVTSGKFYVDPKILSPYVKKGQDVISSENNPIYDIDNIKNRIDSNEEEIFIPELNFEIDERHHGIGHFAANKKYLVYECHQNLGMMGAFRELIVIVSLNDQDRKGRGHFWNLERYFLSDDHTSCTKKYETICHSQQYSP